MSFRQRLPLCLAFTTIVALAACASRPTPADGWFALRWTEQSSANDAAPRTAFLPLVTHDPAPDPVVFERAKLELEVGDVIAYRIDRWQGRRNVETAKVESAPSTTRRYGHLAVIVQDATDPARLRVFSSESFQGPNPDDDVDALRDYAWDAYRLDASTRLDRGRLGEFVRVSLEKSSELFGYGFSGMLGLSRPSAGLRPKRPGEIGHESICSTVVAAAFRYAGLELDATAQPRLDSLTPLQIVTSRGRLVPAPSVSLQADLVEETN